MHNTIIIFLLILLFPISANAAVCDAGYYLKDGVCAECLDNYYCVGDDTIEKCPDMTYTKQELVQLIRDNGFSVESVDRAYVNTLWSAHGVNNTNIEKCLILVLMAHAIQGDYYISFSYSLETNNYTKYHNRYWKTANPGYYLSDIVSWNNIIWYNVKPCTNPHPDSSHYSGPGTPDSADGTIVDANDCPWECDAGYGRTKNDTCEPLCDAGITKLNTSNGLSYNIYAERHTTPSINLLRNNTVCYINLESGSATNAINIQHGNTVYHVTD